MADLQEYITQLTRELELATAEYRAVMRDHLRLRGMKRDAHKPKLEQALELMKELEVKLVGAKLDWWREKLAGSDLNPRERARLRGACEEAERQLQKLLSRLTHDEWLIFTRSVWGFKDTESDAKTGLHPAQFSAVIPYRLIKMYSFIGETVLDPFTGTGTTLIEARRLRRRSIGLEINAEFIELAKRRLHEESLLRMSHAEPKDDECNDGQLTLLLRESMERYREGEDFEPIIKHEDARQMTSINDNSVQIVIAHPPYWNAVRISESPDDLSNIADYNEFLREMTRVFEQVRRVLEPDRVFALVTGDVLKKVGGITQLFPLHSDYIQILRGMGFVLWDVFIWETKIRLSGGKPMMGSYPYPHKLFSQFAHNYVLIFRKLP